MRAGEKASFLIMLAAAGLAVLAYEYKISNLMPLAVALFGIFALWRGAVTITQGNVEAVDRQSARREYYSGASAYIIGLALILIGAALLAGSIISWMQPGLTERFIEDLVKTPQGWGLLMIAFGIFPLLFGMVRVISGSANRTEQRSVLTDLGFRLGGLVSIIAGGLLLLAGLWLVFK